MTSERAIQADILLAIGSRPDVRLWRQNAGRWRTVQHPCARCASSARWIEGAPAGAADLTGIFRGQRLEIEVKTNTGRQSAEQRNWGRMIETQGGIYVLARSVDDALGVLT